MTVRTISRQTASSSSPKVNPTQRGRAKAGAPGVIARLSKASPSSGAFVARDSGGRTSGEPRSNASSGRGDFLFGNGLEKSGGMVRRDLENDVGPVVGAGQPLPRLAQQVGAELDVERPRGLFDVKAHEPRRAARARDVRHGQPEVEPVRLGPGAAADRTRESIAPGRSEPPAPPRQVEG